MSKKPDDSANESSQQPAKRVLAKIDMPEVPCTYEEWRETIMANFPDLIFGSQLCLSVITQLLINDITNPFGVVLVDVPAAGKTITLNFFDGIEPLTYTSDKFTPASFVSNATTVKKDQLAEIDLLPKIKDKTFIVRDMATLFSKRDDDLNELVGTLTRVFDGEGLKTDTGAHGSRQYTGSYVFMFLAASTPLGNRVWKIMSTLGSRLFFVNLKSKDKTEDELMEQLLSSTYKEKELVCRDATSRLLYTLWARHPNGIDWDKSKDSKELVRIITKCARLLAALRGSIVIDRNKDEGEVHAYKSTNIEKPHRLLQYFYNLARGNAVSRSKYQIDDDDLKQVVELALDSAMPNRSNLIRLLIDNDGRLTTSQVEKALGCSKPTARKDMSEFEALGICHQVDDQQGRPGEAEKVLVLNSQYAWFLSLECQQIRGLTAKQLEIIDKVNPPVYEGDDA